MAVPDADPAPEPALEPGFDEELHAATLAIRHSTAAPTLIRLAIVITGDPQEVDPLVRDA